MQKLISIIVPVYNEQEVLSESYRAMSGAAAALPYEYELIYIDDGSMDGTLPLLRELASGDKRVRVISFSRNFGHQLAVTAGMDAAKGDALIIIDVDLQDPPEVMAEMVAAWEQGADIAYGKRIKREGETFFKRFSAHCYYRMLTAMSAYPIPLDTGDFRLIDRKVADAFLTMREHNRFLRGMSAWMGYNSVPVEYVRHERRAGSSKYTLKKMLKLAMDGMLGFSGAPLTAPALAGAAVCLLSLAGFAAVLVCSLTCGAAAWLWGLCGLCLLNGITLIALGIQGAYMQRMLDEVRHRPLYIAKEKINID